MNKLNRRAGIAVAGIVALGCLGPADAQPSEFDAQCHAPPRLLASRGYRPTSEYVMNGPGTAISPSGGSAATSGGLFQAVLRYGKNDGGDGDAGLYLLPQTYDDISSLLFPPLGLKMRAQASLLLLIRSATAVSFAEPISVTFTLPHAVSAHSLRAFYSDDRMDEMISADSVVQAGETQVRAVFPPLKMQGCAAVILSR